MVLRKFPGVTGPGMGLRLSQKFVFLLFLSGLVTLCFGALFFLPDSVRLKRIFLSKNESPAVTARSEGDNKDPRRTGETSKLPEPGAKLRVSRRPSVTQEGRIPDRTPERMPDRTPDRTPERTPDRTVGTQDRTLADAGDGLRDTAASRDSKEVQKGSSYEMFKKCLLKPMLGVDRGKPADTLSVQRRDKVREMMKFAWDNYKQFAWGKNELRPLTRNGHIGTMFGEYTVGLDPDLY
ncbi:mannosyl-oligosaccharide 1,2-alpha-mannosidase IC-like [Hoplias malabaricus]|uniref:mannosyl-oligosaccharide 1,2-alpha-mannosidase IC-like n=1 Tax=Hoplias malabaricus TaxID=27720 RepID=UPI00346303D1